MKSECYCYKNRLNCKLVSYNTHKETKLLGFYTKLNEMSTSHKLTNLQLELLKLFKYELPDSQLIEIKSLLSKYFAEKASDEMDKLWEEKNWDDKTMEDWKNEHMRTKYE